MDVIVHLCEPLLHCLSIYVSNTLTDTLVDETEKVKSVIKMMLVQLCINNILPLMEI